MFSLLFWGHLSHREVIPVINLDLDPLAWKIYSVLPYLLHESYVWHCAGLFLKSLPVSTCVMPLAIPVFCLYKVEHVSTCISDL